MSKASSECNWSSFAGPVLLGALLAGVVVFSLLVVTHKEPARGTF